MKRLSNFRKIFFGFKFNIREIKQMKSLNTQKETILTTSNTFFSNNSNRDITFLEFNLPGLIRLCFGGMHGLSERYKTWFLWIFLYHSSLCCVDIFKYLW